MTTKEEAHHKVEEVLKKDGLSIKEFNSHSIKPFAKLVEEVHIGEVYVDHLPDIGMVKASFRVAVLITVSPLGIQFHEVGRLFRKGKPIWKKERWTFSGTRLKDEDIFMTAKRELEEEAKLKIDPSKLDPDLDDSNAISVNKSRTYYRFQSRVWTQLFTLDFASVPWRQRSLYELKLFDDGEKFIAVKAFDTN